MKSTKDISLEYDVNYANVREWARKNSLPKFCGSFIFDEDAEDRFKNRPVHDGKCSANMIAQKYGKSRSWVVIWARKNGVKKNGGLFTFTPEDERKFANKEGIKKGPGRPRTRPLVSPGPKRSIGRPSKDKPAESAVKTVKPKKEKPAKIPLKRGRSRRV